MLDIKNLNKSYKMGDSSLHVLKGIDLFAKSGEMVAIMGSSGSGKSTLLNIIGILDEADSGDYVLDGVEIKDLNEKKAANYRNQFLGFVFQSFNLINYKTAMENVALPLYYQGLKRKERQEKAMFHLEKVGLAEWAKHLPSELSGGEQQRVAVARALINNPSVIFADEPSGNLDTQSAEMLHKLFFKLRDELNQTFVIVTHNEDLANMADRKLVMKDGLILE